VRGANCIVKNVLESATDILSAARLPLDNTKANFEDSGAMSEVILEKLSKIFRSKAGDVHAVEELSLNVSSGELLAMVGPSGCGKTTMLRLLAGLEKPTSGSIFLNGKLANGLPAKDRDIAMVFQQPALFPHLNVFENIGFGLKLRKFHSAEIETRVKEAAEMLGLSSKLCARPQELSGGEAQRVSLGRALVRRPKVFLLDEPLSSIDVPMRKELRKQIAQIQQILNVPMIYVTHDQREALAIGQRIAVLNHGQLQQIGTPSEIREKPANEFVAEFFNHG
jgi:multiple sugar transport system ATP-binding protein